MEYIQIDSDKFIEYDSKKNISNFISKGSIQKEIDVTAEQLASLPNLPSDEELLAWARENYTNPDMRNKAVLQEYLSELLYKMDQINSNKSVLSKTGDKVE